jgi:hypothetical protein
LQKTIKKKNFTAGVTVQYERFQAERGIMPSLLYRIIRQHRGKGDEFLKMFKPVKKGLIFNLITAAALLLTVLAAAGCMSATKIGDVMANSSKYEGKTITVKGTVGDTVWLATADKGTYQVGDGSGTIWVITTQPPPQKGLTITTEGTVQAAFTLLGTSYGTVINETSRH